MGEYTKRHLLYFKASACGGSGLSVADQLGLIAGYEKLLAERDALAAELAKVKAGLPRWRRDKRQYVLKMARLNMAVVWDYGGGEWASALVGECGESAKTHADQQAAMLAVTEALGLPPCEVEGE